MPTRINSWLCKLCGKSFEQEGHARLCEGIHVKLEGLKVKEICSGMHQSNRYPYSEAEKFPNAIVVASDDGSKEVYVRYRATKPVRYDNPTATESIRLRPR